MLGTNFSLMVKLFPGIDRIDLKRKFKSEEKTNPSLVDKIIATQIPFDISQFIDVECKHEYPFAFFQWYIAAQVSVRFKTVANTIDGHIRRTKTILMEMVRNATIW
uniref:Transcription factor TFIIIB component B'' Myb domain-containing protein n=1 Tax=Daphnia magna TaxID=35525 RepID=A0A0P4ZXN2_9CRUS